MAEQTLLCQNTRSTIAQHVPPSSGDSRFITPTAPTPSQCAHHPSARRETSTTHTAQETLPQAQMSPRHPPSSSPKETLPPAPPATINALANPRYISIEASR
ncbi:hypothetical protein EJ04DRAFT_518523 [Polyplosphaeria fusca]|uniref:Uncharacterized protein n=1 Tax=Polyplosphaeria fusca TaxID=682080 RepID=A0A9P4V9N7_9PLEO|nr:hypothetical protein EJ04DRAFT_518523 [Polyplosphaeria fusca]